MIKVTTWSDQRRRRRRRRHWGADFSLLGGGGGGAPSVQTKTVSTNMTSKQNPTLRKSPSGQGKKTVGLSNFLTDGACFPPLRERVAFLVPYYATMGLIANIVKRPSVTTPAPKKVRLINFYFPLKSRGKAPNQNPVSA